MEQLPILRRNVKPEDLPAIFKRAFERELDRVVMAQFSEPRRVEHRQLNKQYARFFTLLADQSQQPAGSVRDENGRPVQPGLVYAARIDLACGAKDPARHPLCDGVQPGMAVQAEIKTGRRRIIQYLLSPISKAISEAGREE